MNRLPDHPPDDTAEPLDQLREARTVGKHHLRLSPLLLGSKNHNANAVAVLLLIDQRSGKGQPAILRQEVAAAALGLTTKQWKDAVGQLIHEHANSKGVQPAFMQVTKRGQGRADARSVVATATFVKLAPWCLGRLTDPDPERKISTKALRLYAGYVYLSPPNDPDRDPWCEASNATVSRVTGLYSPTIDGLRQELEGAGMVLVDKAKGRRSAVLPLAEELTEDERAELAHHLHDLLMSRDGDRRRPPDRHKAAPSKQGDSESAPAVDVAETTPGNGAVNDVTVTGSDDAAALTGAELREHVRKNWRPTRSARQHEQTA